MKVRSNSQHVAIISLWDFATFCKENQITFISSE